MLVAVLLLATAGLAGARDGRVQINDSVVQAAGGHPYFILASGSYVLAGDLTQPDANTHVISINVSHVTLDLNGFRIQGSADCDPDPSACSGTGSGVGVLSSADNVTVRNGTVAGMGSSGISLSGLGSAVEGVQLYSNGSHGAILTGQGSRTVDCKSLFNGGIGLYGTSGVILHNTSHMNDSGGIGSGGSMVIEGNTVIDSGANGITGTYSVVRGNTVNRSAGSGLSLGGSVAVDNQVSNGSSTGVDMFNAGVLIGNAIHLNGGTGVIVSLGAVVLRNTVTDNGTTGISATTTDAVGENTATGHTGTEISGTVVACNSADGVQSCPP
jgi:hypothetical protein